jgi:hypothetical protein
MALCIDGVDGLTTAALPRKRGCHQRERVALMTVGGWMASEGR